MAKRWYVVHVYSGHENKVAEAIREEIQKKGLDAQFEDILIPSQEVVELHRGKKVSRDKKYFPGYLLIQMELNDDTWHLVKDTPRVTGFLGGRGKPSPITDAEAQRLLAQVEAGVSNVGSTLNFEIGEQLKVCDGPFASFVGQVEEVDRDRQRLKVMVSIFGRATPVELEFSQVERA